MSNKQSKYPSCFAELEHVFPMDSNGLRCSPDSCMPCAHKTQCLKSAIKGPDGNKIKQESIDRAYQSGTMGFLERWSKKKYLTGILRK